MSDRRFLAFSGRVADVALRGMIEAEEFVEAETARLLREVWLRDAPGGRVDRQLLFGDAFEVIERRGEWVFGRSAKDGYVGWVEAEAVGAWIQPTHWVAVRTSWAYGAPDIKTPPLVPLHMTASVTVVDEADGWSRIVGPDEDIWVPSSHVMALSSPRDMIAAARSFLGTPYVWGGNTGFGIDCSGLVQIAAHAARRQMPPDSDVQERIPGRRLGENDPAQQGDLYFWKGHVALATGPETLIHANAYHMMVVEEPSADAVARIAAGETGPVTLRLRPEWPLASRQRG